MRYKIVIGGINDGRHWEYYSCKSLFLDEGEVKVRMYGEEFDSSQLSELAASELPDCEGIVVDCLPWLNSLITQNSSLRGCVFPPID